LREYWLLNPSFPDLDACLSQNAPMTNQFRTKSLLKFTTAAAVLLSQQVIAWGPDGHRVVGALALDQLNEQASQSLIQIMGTNDRDTMVEWCNWPDLYRASDEGAWSEPKHYINMVPGASLYVMERDCPDGMCITESVGEFAAKLADPELDIESRRQAFGWVCHLVGDLHQPLHAGFGHDRGGNEVDIVFNGEPINLHHFWDRALIADRSASWNDLLAELAIQNQSETPLGWQAVEVVSWSNESHAFAESWSYPDNPVITDEFADRSWILAKDQLAKGSKRLARVLNTVLAQGCEKRTE
jgi:hypothetical protein